MIRVLLPRIRLIMTRDRPIHIPGAGMKWITFFNENISNLLSALLQEIDTRRWIGEHSATKLIQFLLLEKQGKVVSTGRVCSMSPVSDTRTRKYSSWVTVYTRLEVFLNFSPLLGWNKTEFNTILNKEVHSLELQPSSSAQCRLHKSSRQQMIRSNEPQSRVSLIYIRTRGWPPTEQLGSAQFCRSVTRKVLKDQSIKNCINFQNCTQDEAMVANLLRRKLKC